MIADLAAHFDRALPRACRGLPGEIQQPCPSSLWPPENIHLYEKYQAWLVEGGAGEHATDTIYLPLAGQILGLNPYPYRQYDLTLAFEKLLDFARAKGLGQSQQKVVRNGMEKFRRFVRLELGLGEVTRFRPFNLQKHTQGLPEWLVQELSLYQRSLQKNWRPSRVHANLLGFWSKHCKMWRFMCLEQGVQQLADLKRTHILAFIDAWIEKKYAINTINCYILYLRGFLAFLQQQGYSLPESLVKTRTLKQPDSLPKYLRDDEVVRLRQEIQARAAESGQFSTRRQALLDQALFYLLWQGGLRVSELEDICLGDLDLPGRRLKVVNGKGRKDRTVYLTDTVVAVLRQYLPVRGTGSAENVFLYRNAPLGRAFIGSRLRTLGRKLDVKVHAHCLRHTFATQLLNAGCRVTSIQKILGHENIRTTLVYARAYDQTVADDFYSAMARVEQRLAVAEETGEDEIQDENVKVLDTVRLLSWVERLSQPNLDLNERLELAGKIKTALVSGRSFAARAHQAASPPS